MLLSRLWDGLREAAKGRGSQQEREQQSGQADSDRLLKKMLVVHKLMMPEREKRLPANSPWSDDEPPSWVSSEHSIGERQKNSLDAELLGVNRLAIRCIKEQ